ncbi:MAG: hypothetical protein IJ661_12175 [Lachnospiraceae bacterium]|nr:hypothetical protein [Lachnospiraceae bacterium]
MNIYSRYIEIKDNKNVRSKTDRLIRDCFKYKIFEKKPSKKRMLMFKEHYNADYPFDTKELTDELISRLNHYIDYCKEMDEAEERCRRERAERGFSYVDAHNIHSWFMKIMPEMLTYMKDNLRGFPDFNVSYPGNSQCYFSKSAEVPQEADEWKEILDRMIFLLREMNPDTCSMKNEYDEEYYKVLEDFKKKYGMYGDGLKSEEEKQKEEEEGAYTWYGPSDFPELYPDFQKLYYEHSLRNHYIYFYRDKCREEFFNLFSKYFWDLWD